MLKINSTLTAIFSMLILVNCGHNTINNQSSIVEEEASSVASEIDFLDEELNLDQELVETSELTQNINERVDFSLSSATALENNDVRTVYHLHTLLRGTCLLYTSPSPRDQRGSRMPSSA